MAKNLRGTANQQTTSDGNFVGTVEMQRLTAKQQQSLRENPVTNMAIFGSKYANQVVTMTPAYRDREKYTRGSRIQFRDGIYRTDKPAEIAMLKDLIDNPSPGCVITLIQDLPESLGETPSDNDLANNA